MSSDRRRRGAVLLIVVGIAAMLISLTVAFIGWMRADAEEANVTVAEAQARIVFHGALMYLQETSRLGWSDIQREASSIIPTPATQTTYGWRETASPSSSVNAIRVGAVSDRGGEAFGWTDIRNGWLGPLVARDPTTAAIPAPRWWQRYVEPAPSPRPLGWPSDRWPEYRPSPDETSAGIFGGAAEFPRADLRRWPCPGSATRCLLAVCAQAPYAVELTATYNPFVPMRSDNASATELSPTDPDWDADWGGIFNRDDKWLAPSAANVGYRGSRGYVGMLDPQPVADTWDTFAAGKPSAGAALADNCYLPENQWQLRAGTGNLAWFRIYREMQRDHNGDQQAIKYTDSAETQVAWLHDNSALYHGLASTYAGNTPGYKNWSVFVIACGSGATRGFRFWSLDANDPRRALEPVTAEECGLFGTGDSGHALFDELRSKDRILWFRVEWTPLMGGAVDGNAYGTSTSSIDGTLKLNSTYGGPSGGRQNSPASFGGSFRTIQRLDREPPNW